MRDDLLFYKYEISSVLAGHTEALKKRIQSIDAKTLLGANETNLVEALVEEFLLEVPVIQVDDIYIAESQETQVDVSGDHRRMVFDRSQPCYVPGTKTVIAVPFRGDSTFFSVRPQTYTLNPPRAVVSDGELRLTYVRTDHDGEAIKREYQQTVASINSYLGYLEQSASQFNSQLPSLVTSTFKARKDRLLADAGMTASIGLPLKKRTETPLSYSVPVQRRAPKIENVRVDKEFKPEPALSAQDYEEILRITKNMVQVMELSPHAFRNMGEEDLRTHFLVHLNGVFAGQATGETFNFQGKTDILIRASGRNVFIAECKVWKGPKALIATIDQLLSYLSWRDTKAAILVFNRNADFSAVLEKISETVPAHPQFLREVERDGESTFRYTFTQPNDANREITVAVLAFDVPTESTEVNTLAAASPGS